MIAAPSYLDIIESYHQFREAAHELIESVMTGIASTALLDDNEARKRAAECLHEKYPFADLLYILDEEGIQITEFLMTDDSESMQKGRGINRDRSQRPYFLSSKDSDSVVTTEPYFSIARRQLCISGALRLHNRDSGLSGYLILDFDLEQTLSFLMGDTRRRQFEPWFRGVYSLIVFGLMVVVALLLYTAFSEIVSLFTVPHTVEDEKLKPFGIVIFLTLGLAIFDLGKTVFEEEVLMPKEYFRLSATRRTITRFIAAILIAVSIEALLLMFKSVLGDPNSIMAAVAMMVGAVGLLIGLGIFVYLGARAEEIMSKTPRLPGSKNIN